MAGSGEEAAPALKKGPWTAAEDVILVEYVKAHGEGNWNSVQKNSGLSRCGKSCRLRWANHLRPNLKKGSFSPEEERLILELHAKFGNKWARMAAQLPGRTDNEIKNYWNTRIKRRLRAGLPLYPPEIQRQAAMSQHRAAAAPSSPAPNFSSPLDPMCFSAPAAAAPLGHLHQSPRPFLSSPPPHRAALTAFSLPFSSTPPLFHQNLHSQQQQNFGSVRFNFNPPNFDLIPQILQPQFAHVIKLELPSSQLPEAGRPSGPEPYNPVTPLESSSALLDALLQEAEEMASEEDSRRERDLPDSVGLFPSSIQWEGDAGAQLKKEPGEEMNSVGENLSSFLKPSSNPEFPDWYSDSGEASNGQSAATDDDIGLEMQHLASTEQGWSPGACPWNNMPRIC